VTDEHTPFLRLGGEAGVRRLVDRFYDLMDELPEASHVRAMHPDDLVESREKLWMFLCGFLGGPQLYIERHGHPRLRARHLPFPVDEAARDQWLLCMSRALEEQVPEELLRMQLGQTFARVADHMRNRPG
jgi:hemoglobin